MPCSMLGWQLRFVVGVALLGAVFAALAVALVGVLTVALIGIVVNVLLKRISRRRVATCGGR
jgi:hypothetical protein